MSSRRLFVCRHGQRVDHQTPEWASHATRPHDGPITPLGWDHALELGSHLRAAAHAGSDRCDALMIAGDRLGSSSALWASAVQDVMLCEENL